VFQALAKKGRRTQLILAGMKNAAGKGGFDNAAALFSGARPAALPPQVTHRRPTLASTRIDTHTSQETRWMRHSTGEAGSAEQGPVSVV
jgi:hypothetical protein